MKNCLIYGLLVYSLGSLCYGQQSTNTGCNPNGNTNCHIDKPAAVNQGSAVAQAVFGPVLIPPSSNRPSATSKAETPAPTTITPTASAPVREKSLGEIARGYRSRNNRQHLPAIEELGSK